MTCSVEKGAHTVPREGHFSPSATTKPGCDKAATKTIMRSRSAGEPSNLGAAAPTGTSMATSASRDRAETGCL